MTSILKTQLSGIGIAAAVALASIVPASAGPMMSNATGVKNAGLDNVVDVRWRRYGWGGAGLAAGVAAGALFGAAIANSAYGYGPGYYGYAPAYSYGYAPTYSYGYGSSYYEPYGAYAYSPSYPYGRRQYYYETPVGPPMYSQW